MRVSISTNGLRLLYDRGLVDELRKRNVVVALQFDGFKEEAYEVLRGRKLLETKLQILDMLEREQFSTSLTMTAAGGVNDDQFAQMLDYLFSHDNVSSIMIQPAAFTGRASLLSDRIRPLGIPEITGALGSAGNPAVSSSDFVPLPCSHPLCFSLAFYLMLDNKRPVSINRLVGVDTVLDSIANQVFFGMKADENEKLRDLIYDLWSAPAASVPDSEEVLNTLRGIMRELSRTSCGPRSNRSSSAATTLCPISRPGYCAGSSASKLAM